VNSVNFLPILALTLIACAQTKEVEIEFTQADADALAVHCSAPTTWLKVEPVSSVRFELPVDYTHSPTDHKKIACLLQGVREAGVTKFGFVGNEKYPVDNE